MLVRIDTFEVDGTTVVQITGQLGGDGVAELAATLRSVTAPWAVDVALLRTADAEGIGFLRSVVEAGGELRNVPPYIRMLLAQPAME